MQLVTIASEVVARRKVVIALPGAVLDNGQAVRREKIGGEWSEGIIVDILESRSEASEVAACDANCEWLNEDRDINEVAAPEYQVLPFETFEGTILDTEIASGSIRYVSGDASKA